MSVAPGLAPPPLAGGGRGEGPSGTCIGNFDGRCLAVHYRVAYRFQNPLKIFPDLLARDPQNPQSFSLHPAIPSCIGVRISMRNSVDLHDQACGGAEEIGDEGTDRLLATELGACDLAGAQRPPEYGFTTCGFAAHRSGEREKSGWDDPSPCPPPARGGGTWWAAFVHPDAIRPSGECKVNRGRVRRMPDA